MSSATYRKAGRALPGRRTQAAVPSGDRPGYSTDEGLT